MKDDETNRRKDLDGAKRARDSEVIEVALPPALDRDAGGEAAPKLATPSRAPRRRLRIRRVVLAAVVLILILPIFLSLFGKDGPAAEASDEEKQKVSFTLPQTLPPAPPPSGSGSFSSPLDVPKELPQKKSASPEKTVSTSMEFTGDEATKMMQKILEARQQLKADKTAAPADAEKPDPARQGERRTIDVEPYGAVSVKVRPSTAEQSYQLLLVFPQEKKIQSTVSSFREQDVSILSRDNTVAIKLRNEKTAGDLHVVGASQIVYPVRISASETEYDDVVTIRMRAKVATGKRAPNVAAELAMAMYRRSNPAGVLVFDGQRKLLYDRDGLQMRVLYLYQAPHHLGYIFEVTNRNRSPRLIEKEKFKAPGLIMVGSEAARLEAGDSTTVYFIYQRGPNE